MPPPRLQAMSMSCAFRTLESIGFAVALPIELWPLNYSQSRPSTRTKTASRMDGIAEGAEVGVSVRAGSQHLFDTTTGLRV